MRNGSTQKSRWILNVAAWPQPADPVCNARTKAAAESGYTAAKIEPHEDGVEDGFPIESSPFSDSMSDLVKRLQNGSILISLEGLITLW